MTGIPVGTTHRHGAARFQKRHLVSAFMLVIIVATGFNTFLTALAFKNSYVSTLASQFDVVGSSLKRKIEISLHFGKDIERFYGMEPLLQQHLAYLEGLTPGPAPPEPIRFFLTDPAGRLLYTADRSDKPLSLTQPILTDLLEAANSTAQPLNLQRQYLMAFPITNPEGTLCAVQIIAFPEIVVSRYLFRILQQSLLDWLLVIAAGIAALSLLLTLLLKKYREPATLLGQKSFSYTLFTIIGVCQVLLSLSQVQDFSRHYLAVNQTRADALARVIKDQVEAVLDKGINLKHLTGTDTYLAGLIADLPEFDSLLITAPDKNPLFYADRDRHLSHASLDIQAISGPEPAPHVRSTSLETAGKDAGTLSVTISRNRLNAFMKRTLLDTVTIILVSIFFCGEVMLLFIIGFLSGRSTTAQPRGISTRIIRPVAFIYFFAIDIVVSFVPLHMKDLYNASPLTFIPPDMAPGLPITLQMIFTAGAILLVGNWCDKRGWHSPFNTGLVLSALGFLGAAFAASPILFLTSLTVVGFGYGLSYIAAQNFVTSNSLPEHKARGLSEYYAGCTAGSLCGIVTGSMLAEQIGFANVFFAGFIILVAVTLFTAVAMRPWFIRPAPPSQEGKTSAVRAAVRFIKDRRILSILALNIIPAAAIIAGFLYYFIPVYLEQNNVSQSDIGRVFMIYGICMIYVSPFVTRNINALKHSVNSIALGGMFYGLTTVIFYLTAGYRGVVAGVLLLSLGTSFNAIRNAWALNQDISGQVGEGLATSLIFFLARLGQALGPIAFALVYTQNTDAAAITTIGLIMLAMTALFFAVNRPPVKGPGNEVSP